MDLLYRLFYHIYRCTNTELINFIINQLEIRSKAHEIILHRPQYPKPIDDNRPGTAFHYFGNNLFCAAAIWNTVDNFKHLASHIKESEFHEHIFIDDMNQRNVIETIVQFDRFDLAKYVLSMQYVRDKYANNTDLIFRAVYFLFTKSQNMEMFDYVLKELDINQSKIEGTLDYKYPEPDEEPADFAFDFHHFTILNRIVINERLASLKKMAEIVGETVFCKHLTGTRSQFNQYPLETAAEHSQFEIAKYLLSFKVLRDAYIDDEDLRFRVVYYLFTKCEKDEMIDYVLRELGMTKDLVLDTLTHECEKPGEGEFGEDASDYHLYSIVNMIIMYDKADRLAKLRAIIGGDDEFAKGVFHRDGWGDNALETAVEQKFTDCITSLLQMDIVKKRYLDEKELLHPVLEKLNENFDVSVCELLVKELKLTEKKLKTLKEYEELDIDGILRVINK